MWSASGTQRVVAGEGLAEGVDRAGADIAEDDADRADRQLGERALGMAVAAVVRSLGTAPRGCGDVHAVKLRIRAQIAASVTIPCPTLCGGAAD